MAEAPEQEASARVAQTLAVAVQVAEVAIRLRAQRTERAAAGQAQQAGAVRTTGSPGTPPAGCSGPGRWTRAGWPAPSWPSWAGPGRGRGLGRHRPDGRGRRRPGRGPDGADGADRDGPLPPAAGGDLGRRVGVG